MGAINMKATMDALAAVAVAQGVTQRAYPWPSDNIEVPCLVVGYPTSIDFDYTFGRGSDEATFPLYFVAGAVADKQAVEVLSNIITGATGIKDKLDGTLGGVVQTCRIVDCVPESIEAGTVRYIAARFDAEVVS